MDLFGTIVDPTLNLLPHDGTVHYYGEILDTTQSDNYFATLYRDTPWQHDRAIIRGKLIITARRVAWYGNEAYHYTYSGTTKQALPWTDTLLALKACVEEKAGTRYNSCLINLYDDGNTGMAWHSDDERMLGENPSIASLSLGVQRKFAFKHKKTKQVISLELAHGSLLLMQDETQAHWHHSLPKTVQVKQPRINLTFRTIVSF